MRNIVILLALLSAWPAAAQQSTSFKIGDHAFNSGGYPLAGTVLESTSYHITLSAVGDSVVMPGLSGASFGLDAGFGSCYPPPREVQGLEFGDAGTLTWDAERSVGHYNLYRGLLSDLAGLSYGACEQRGLSGNGAEDPELPQLQSGYFYLVTAANRLHEEGSKGFHSDGTGRQGAVCP